MLASTGFSRNENAPSFMASTAAFTVPCPVRTMTRVGMGPQRRKTSSPPIPFILRSRRAMSGGALLESTSTASSPLTASDTSWPLRRSAFAIAKRNAASSSMISTLPFIARAHGDAPRAHLQASPLQAKAVYGR